MRTLAHIGYVVADMDRAVRRFETEGSVVVIPPTGPEAAAPRHRARNANGTTHPTTPSSNCAR